MQFFWGDTKAVRIATHFIQREQTVIEIQGCILKALRHDRGSHLLKLADKTTLLCLLVGARRRLILSSSMSRTNANSSRLTVGLRRCAWDTACWT